MVLLKSNIKTVVVAAIAVFFLGACDDKQQKPLPKLSTDFTSKFTEGCLKGAPQAACVCVLEVLSRDLSPEETDAINQGTFDKTKLIEKIHAASVACKK